MDKATRTGGEIRLPRAGTIFVPTAITTAVVLDLAASGGPQAESTQFASNIPWAGSPAQPVSVGGGTVATASQNQLAPQGFVGFWITIAIDGSDVGVISGSRNADVSGANAPVLATTGAAGTAGVCQRWFSGGTYHFFVTPDDRFLGVVSAGTTTLRIAVSSRP